MSARQSILERLRSTTIANPPAMPDVQSWYDAHRRDEHLSQRVERLRAAMEAVKTEVHDTTDSDWADLLMQLAVTKGVRKLLIGADTLHSAELEARHSRRQASPSEQLELHRYIQPISAWRQELFDTMDASFTLARSAIAETGSLILERMQPAYEDMRMGSAGEFKLAQRDVKDVSAQVGAALTGHMLGGFVQEG